jgi:hypothetical protein
MLMEHQGLCRIPLIRVSSCPTRTFVTRHNPGYGIMGQHLLPTSDQCIQRRRTRTRSVHRQASCMDPHKPLAGPRSPARPQNARCAMSSPDHARANFRMLLRAAADGNLASESTNDTDLLAQRVADLEPARSHVLLASRSHRSEPRSQR